MAGLPRRHHGQQRGHIAADAESLSWRRETIITWLQGKRSGQGDEKSMPSELISPVLLVETLHGPRLGVRTADVSVSQVPERDNNGAERRYNHQNSLQPGQRRLKQGMFGRLWPRFVSV